MVDFNALLNTNLDDVKTPQALPVGTYTFMVDSWEQGESAKKKTPYVEFQCKPIKAEADVDQSLLEGIDLERKTLRYTFYLTQDSKYRLKKFLTSLGITTDDRTIKDALTDTKGTMFLGKVSQRPSDREGDDSIYNDIETSTKV